MQIELIGVSYECCAECNELYFNEQLITQAHSYSKYFKILLKVWKAKAHSYNCSYEAMKINKE